ncbi:bifunctional dihydrofolate reductase-thymidylatesynthase [Striga asiatica]|uniref:Bifunctional dihydrofolate reductase-thymidylate synthase n=1 Tax=Striga asiatica TaxID=4170 RepID=A0A5A7PGM4_STRAF|nr:bifunctional dihydrofolate reductase-thymidylatesynthase [Striga asiatica]
MGHGGKVRALLLVPTEFPPSIVVSTSRPDPSPLPPNNCSEITIHSKLQAVSSMLLLVALVSLLSSIFRPASESSFVLSLKRLKPFPSKRFCRKYLTMSGNSNGSLSSGKILTQPSSSFRTYQVVVAATPDMGIGKDGKLPWKLPGDLKFFKEITTTTLDPKKKNAVMMGRKTWESIPPQFRPLPGRLNVILTRSGSPKNHDVENVIFCNSVPSALKLLAEPPYSISVDKVFLIGGGEILREALNAPECDAIHITEIKSCINCDTFIPPIDTSLYQPWYSTSPLEENGIPYCFSTYVRLHTNSGCEINCDGRAPPSKKLKISNYTFLPKFIFEKHEEYLYLRLIEDIILNGNTKGDRTGTGTLSKFGCQMRFNLRKSFPLLTTKLLKSFCGSSVVQQMLSIGLTEREEGDLGPVYGFQWRHFGARYTNMHADYAGQGFDQLLDVINKIKNKPDDRRIILSAWNPSDLNLMALPPCHMFAQFYVANGELSCQMYQRSADMGLGVPFNIASYALLTCMIAHVCGLVPGDFVHVIGDAHVYKTHIGPLQEQLKKQPRPFPILTINQHKKDIDSFVAADFELKNYEPHPKLEMKMAV